MPAGAVLEFDCDRAGGNLVFRGVIVSISDGAAGGITVDMEGATDGVPVGAGLHAANRRMMVMDISSFFRYIFCSLLNLPSADYGLVISIRASHYLISPICSIQALALFDQMVHDREAAFRNRSSIMLRKSTGRPSWSIARLVSLNHAPLALDPVQSWINPALVMNIFCK